MQQRPIPDGGAKKSSVFTLLFCGGGGIRTPGTFQYNSFQDCRHRPLGHASESGVKQPLNMLLFLREELPLEQDQVDGTYRDAAVREIKYRLEEYVTTHQWNP